MRSVDHEFASALSPPLWDKPPRSVVADVHGAEFDSSAAQSTWETVHFRRDMGVARRNQYQCSEFMGVDANVGMWDNPHILNAGPAVCRKSSGSL